MWQQLPIKKMSTMDARVLWGFPQLYTVLVLSLQTVLLQAQPTLSSPLGRM